MSNNKGQPGYMPPVEPHKPRPMFPSGRVNPPDIRKRMSGKEKNAAKKEAERLVAKAINTPEWMVLAFRINPETGAVVMDYRLTEFPVDSFEEAAGLFAQVLTEQLGETFGPQQQAEMQAAAEAARAPAQNSEPVATDAECNALPSTLGGPGEEVCGCGEIAEAECQKLQAKGECEANKPLDDGRQAPGRMLPGESEPPGEVY